MATRATTKSNKAGTGYSVSGNSIPRRNMDNMDKANNSSIVAMIAAATAVIALLLVVPPMLDMYIVTNRNNTKMEVRDKQWITKVEKLEDMIQYNEQLLKDINKSKNKE